MAQDGAVTLRTWEGIEHRVDLVGQDTVEVLRSEAAHLLNAPFLRVQLLCKGRVLTDKADPAALQAGDEVLAVVTPRSPPAFARPAWGHRANTTEDTDALHFELPVNASSLQRRLAAFLQHKLHLPELLLIILFGVRLRTWLAAVVWVIFAPVAARLEVGPLYVLGSICAIIFLNLGQRKAGEASAYSIFNGFRALPGQLTADELDAQVRQGRMG